MNELRCYFLVPTGRLAKRDVERRLIWPRSVRWQPGFVAACRGIGRAMTDFRDEAKDFADDHGDKVDPGLRQAGDKVDDRTGGKYADKIEKGVDDARRPHGRRRPNRVTTPGRSVA